MFYRTMEEGTTAAGIPALVDALNYQAANGDRKFVDVLRYRDTSRGGGIEIDASEITGIEGCLMTAYQNYLGGGIRGRVCGDCNIPGWEDDEKLSSINEELRRFYFEETNPTGGTVWLTFERNQLLESSAY